jgi:large subunit ribosomal protein L24
MKPTKMRNQMIYQATFQTKNKQLGSALSKDLHKKYGKRSVRVVEGDSVTILRGEFKGVDGKVAKVSTQKSSVAIEGVKKEKTKGDKFDVYIHTSNLVVTSLNGEDKWRMAKLEGKAPKKQPKTETKAPKETKVEDKVKKEGDKE